MLIALPTYGQMISPRFDCAPVLLLVQTEKSRISERREVRLETIHWRRRTSLIAEQGVKVLLCGGIRRCDYYDLLAAKIEVIAGLTGRFEEILIDYLAGRLPAAEPWNRPCRELSFVENTNRGGVKMPNRDGSGPQGQGAGQGRGRGGCGQGQGAGKGRGVGSGQGQGGGQGLNKSNRQKQAPGQAQAPDKNSN